MDEVNLYVYTTGKHQFKHKLIVAHYLVECIRDGNLYTYPPEDKDTFECWENSTPERAASYLIARAVGVILYYLGQTKDVKTVQIYLDRSAARPFINGWPLKWEASGYMTAHGTEVKNRDLWEQYNAQIHKLDGVNLAFTTAPNSYESIMLRQAEKELERIEQNTAANG